MPRSASRLPRSSAVPPTRKRVPVTAPRRRRPTRARRRRLRAGHGFVAGLSRQALDLSCSSPWRAAGGGGRDVNGGAV
ncbi:MAG: hypothetical protein EBZ59_09980 [Planctomycetia bacterium]|nr:hypothetical protein [Planctomycetia bacterium]